MSSYNENSRRQQQELYSRCVAQWPQIRMLSNHGVSAVTGAPFEWPLSEQLGRFGFRGRRGPSLIEDVLDRVHT